MDPEARFMGIYRGRIERELEHRRFRLLLFAELPDRLHGEVLSPLGTTELIIDGGDGVLAVTWVDERTAFVGPASSRAIAELLGVGVDLEHLVRAVLLGQAPPGDHVVTREAATTPGLPEEIEISGPGGKLRLELRRTRVLQSTDGLGTGQPRAGFEVRPLSQLQLAPIGEPEPAP